jgi:hypothetical protein
MSSPLMDSHMLPFAHFDSYATSTGTPLGLLSLASPFLRASAFLPVIQTFKSRSVLVVWLNMNSFLGGPPFGCRSAHLPDRAW